MLEVRGSEFRGQRDQRSEVIGAKDPKTREVAPADRVEPVAKKATNAHFICVIRSASYYTYRILVKPFAPIVGTIVIVLPLTLAPLPHVAAHLFAAIGTFGH